MDTLTARIVGLDPERLADFWNTGLDHNGNAADPFIDDAGGWPLRCCLRDSRPGDQLAIVAWSPFPDRGPYAETGPVVVHATPCGGPESDNEVPAQFRSRRQILRPYGKDQRIAYDHIRLIEADDDIETAIADLIANDDIMFVHARNVLSGCYSFAIQRSGGETVSADSPLKDGAARQVQAAG